MPEIHPGPDGMRNVLSTCLPFPRIFIPKGLVQMDTAQHQDIGTVSVEIVHVAEH